MGVEIIVGAIVCFSGVFGLIAPVGFWAFYLYNQRKKFQNLLEGHGYSEFAEGQTSAALPLSLACRQRSSSVDISALLRGSPLWQVTLTFDEYVFRKQFHWVSAAWAEVWPHPEDWRPATAEPSSTHRLHLPTGSASENSRMVKAVIGSVFTDGKEIDVLVSGHTLTIRGARRGLHTDEALVWLFRANELSRALGAPDPLPEERRRLSSSAAYDGVPVGVSSG